MIGKLSGIIDSFGEKHLILDVQGVGYLVHAGSRTLTQIGNTGDPVSLLIETQVREDAITLFGFKDAAEQSWFRLLTSVQGVGAKVALAILSVAPPERLMLIIASQDKTGLTAADGVGPKLAIRILTELKDKAAGIDLGKQLKATATNAPAAAQQEPASNSSLDQDAVSALVNLGYPRADAYSAVMQVKARGANDNLGDIIREALKELSA